MKLSCCSSAEVRVWAQWPPSLHRKPFIHLISLLKREQHGRATAGWPDVRPKLKTPTAELRKTLAAADTSDRLNLCHFPLALSQDPRAEFKTGAGKRSCVTTGFDAFVSTPVIPTAQFHLGGTVGEDRSKAQNNDGNKKWKWGIGYEITQCLESFVEKIFVVCATSTSILTSSSCNACLQLMKWHKTTVYAGRYMLFSIPWETESFLSGQI